MLVIPFPAIDPTLVEFGPFAIRWYALAYIAGILIGWRYALHLARSSPAEISREALDDFLVWVTLGIVLGGRIGYILFYNFDYFMQNPLHMFYVWRGGMSFHGGMLGVILAIILFAWHRKIAVFALGDIVACVTPIGLFLGRCANFVNGELYGRPSDVPWAMVFPRDPLQLPRHPSQLYEAFLEGIVLFTVLWALWRFTRLRMRPGAMGGCFLIGYGLCRIFAEFFREPDPQLGFLLGGVTMGQILSVPMVLIGIGLLVWARPLARKPAPQDAKKAAKKKA